MSERLFEVSESDPAAGLQELRSLESDLDAVEAALRRLDAGSYGTCETCGAPLADLEADPLARHCPSHRPPTSPPTSPETAPLQIDATEGFSPATPGTIS